MDNRAERALGHLWEVLYKEEVPRIPEELKDISLLAELHRKLADLRRTPGPGGDRDGRNRAAAAPGRGEYQFRRLNSRGAAAGIFNRRTFVERAAAEFRGTVPRDKRRNQQCCLAVMDLDRLKRLNLRHGRPAGDAALKHTARVMSEHLRRTDFIGRCGGGEFAVFFWDMDMETCRRICERVLYSLAAAPLILEAGIGYVTASCGIAAAGLEEFAPAENSSACGTGIIRKLADRAGKALYLAKNGGRNRTACYRRGLEDIPVRAEWSGAEDIPGWKGL
jgi:diguanylate cyclase (GGDEF)-like protein